ncbi:MAG: ribosomal-processing cysteine protease Prp [Lachnospiraceae bacterium]|nr:ribosomal-processing cysteine protease Prp [Lachnospiraceae bacterium]
MITITFYAKEIEQNVKVNLESVTGFSSEGHAGYAKHGKDIVCAAVSALVMNTMNSIHSFTSDVFDYSEDEKKGMIDFRIVSEPSPETTLLLKSLILGLQSIQEEYGEKYLRIVFQNS